MKVIIASSMLVLFCQIGRMLADQELTLGERFEQYRKDFNKQYANQVEQQQRFRNWVKTDVFIVKHNAKYQAGETTYTVAHNFFSDLTREESAAYRGIAHNISEIKHFGTVDEQSQVFELPKEVDWRKHGAVNPIQDQGACGSCWAFSAVASTEGQYFMKYGKLKKFSEQQLVDCVAGPSCEKGGLMDRGFRYLENHGLELEKDYKYTGIDEECKYSEAKAHMRKVKGWFDIQQGNEAQLTQKIATVGPVSIAIDANGDGFRFYKSGIYTAHDCSSRRLDHGIVVVGYGTEGDLDYYTVRNSWGKDWGDHGYIKMVRNQKNHCGVASMASYPVLHD